MPVGLKLQHNTINSAFQCLFQMCHKRFHPFVLCLLFLLGGRDGPELTCPDPPPPLACNFCHSSPRSSKCLSCSISRPCPAIVVYSWLPSLLVAPTFQKPPGFRRDWLCARCKIRIPYGVQWVGEGKALPHASGNVFCSVFFVRVRGDAFLKSLPGLSSSGKSARRRTLQRLSFNALGFPPFCVPFVVLSFTCAFLAHCSAPVPVQVHHDK